jgi:hypothetical protein
MEFFMRTVLITAASTAICAFLAAAPAFAQDTVTGAPPGQAPVTVEGYGYGPGQPGQPGIGNDYPAGYGYGFRPGYAYPGYAYSGYGYANPWAGAGIFAPIGALAWGLNTAGAIATAPFGGAPYYGAPAPVPAAPVVAATSSRCRAFQDWNGRRTAVCGP